MQWAKEFEDAEKLIETAVQSVRWMVGRGRMRGDEVRRTFWVWGGVVSCYAKEVKLNMERFLRREVTGSGLLFVFIFQVKLYHQQDRQIQLTMMKNNIILLLANHKHVSVHVEFRGPVQAFLTVWTQINYFISLHVSFLIKFFICNMENDNNTTGCFEVKSVKQNSTWYLVGAASITCHFFFYPSALTLGYQATPRHSYIWCRLWMLTQRLHFCLTQVCYYAKWIPSQDI